ncbi:carboxylesterase [Williamsia sp. 1138]|uniref:carboxylesterase/lipase family protein n=1 Tax=Williamsia sp. 1138 TaxID=1903117 RepID=UPI000A0FFE09|nr:carboxylesterase family protein [Williamsia sp. 1138]OZG26430.1 carboxylesterase [Williamsia sp. 1138]
MTVRSPITPFTLLVAALALIVTGCGTSQVDNSDAPLEVGTTSGELQGSATETTREFLGVRYAQPPTGDRRWTLPQPVSTPDEQVDATKVGSRCAQQAVQPGAASSTEEDCLFLNVTTPRAHSEKPLPVLVWWHGGGFTHDAGSDYDPTRIAAEGNVIVVTVNYRLGMFGYLGLPGLEGSGNFGFADQIASLRWVDDNAAAFGGDPDNVTVFGQSAGGMSTCAVLSSPAATGLVDKAAIMSGACGLRWPNGVLFPGVPEQTPYTSLAASENNGADVATGLGCVGADQIDCLRRLPADRLVPLGENFSNVLAYGTDLLPTDPDKAARDGDTTPIPVMIGSTRVEQRSFVGAAMLVDPASVTADSYPTLLSDAFGPSATRIAERYPLVDYPSAGVAWSTVTTDAAWSCPTARTARELAKTAPVYTYEFADPTAPNVNGITLPDLPQEAAHATDLPYLFNLNGQDLLRTPAQHQLSSTMIDYLAGFARTGTPSSDGSPTWQETTGTETPVMRFEESGARVAGSGSDHHCDLWDAVAMVR